MPVVTSGPRTSAVANAIRSARLIVVLRRVSPRSRLVELVGGLLDAGAAIFEITFDAPDAADDVAALRTALAGKAGTWIGAGTLRTLAQVDAAVDAGAQFGASPVLDRDVVRAAADRALPFLPGASSPTEVDGAWRAGATFVKLFPASSLGPGHVRELRGPLPEVELVATGGIDATNAAAFLAAGAVAVGVGSALLRGTPDERPAIVEAVRAAPRP